MLYSPNTAPKNPIKGKHTMSISKVLLEQGRFDAILAQLSAQQSQAPLAYCRAVVARAAYMGLPTKRLEQAIGHSMAFIQEMIKLKIVEVV